MEPTKAVGCGERAGLTEFSKVIIAAAYLVVPEAGLISQPDSPLPNGNPSANAGPVKIAINGQC